MTARGTGGPEADDRPGEGGGTLLSLVRAASEPQSRELVRARITRAHQLSVSYLGLGFVVIGVLIAVRGFASFLWSLQEGIAPWLPSAAWLIVIASAVVGVLVAVSRRAELPPSAAAAVLAVGVLAIALEFVAYRTAGAGVSYYPTVGIAVGSTLLALMPFQPLSRTVRSIGVLVAVSVLTLAVQSLTSPESIGIGVTNLVLSTAPVGVSAVFLRTLDGFVEQGLDRSVSDSMINAPGTGLGRLEALELSQIDARIEGLLDRVAHLPEGEVLDAGTGEQARLLADELRLTLARSHERTWLHIAVEESAHLSQSVVVTDPRGLAAALPPADRARLLAVLWLLTTVPAGQRTATELVFAGPPPLGPPTASDIEIGTATTRPRDLDASVWGILGELGGYRVSVRDARTAIHLTHPGPRKTTP